MKYQVPVVMDSDAHVDLMAGNHAYALEMLQMVNFPEELVLNSQSGMLYDYINFKP